MALGLQHSLSVVVRKGQQLGGVVCCPAWQPFLLSDRGRQWGLVLKLGNVHTQWQAA